MKTARASVVVSAILGKIASVIGYSIGVFGILGFIVEMSEDRETFGFVLAFILIAVGVFLVLKGLQIKRRIRRFKEYVFLISQGKTSLEHIASSTSQSVDFVRRDLQKMINKRFFASAAIDIATNQILIGGVVPQPAPSILTPQVSVAPPQFINFTCSGCGATGTKPEGTPTRCEYCGSVLA